MISYNTASARGLLRTILGLSLLISPRRHSPPEGTGPKAPLSRRAALPGRVCRRRAALRWIWMADGGCGGCSTRRLLEGPGRSGKKSRFSKTREKKRVGLAHRATTATWHSEWVRLNMPTTGGFQIEPARSKPSPLETQ